MKLSFTNLEIEYNASLMQRSILRLIEFLEIKKFNVTIRMPNTEGYFEVSGTDTGTLLDAIKIMMKEEKYNTNHKGGKKW